MTATITEVFDVETTWVGVLEFELLQERGRRRIELVITSHPPLTNGTTALQTCRDFLVLVCFFRASSRNRSPCIGWFLEECNTSIAKYQRSSEGIPYMRRPASNEITSDYVELCDTAVCFLHIQLLGTTVRLPKIEKFTPR